MSGQDDFRMLVASEFELDLARNVHRLAIDGLDVGVGLREIENVWDGVNARHFEGAIRFGGGASLVSTGGRRGRQSKTGTRVRRGGFFKTNGTGQLGVGRYREIDCYVGAIYIDGKQPSIHVGR